MAHKIINVNGKEVYKAYLPVPNDLNSRPKRCALVDKITGKLIGFFPVNVSFNKLRKII